MRARNLLQGVLPVNKVTERFIHVHSQELSTIADKNADEGEPKKAILKRGGAGILGGTIIRHLFRWETQKKKRAPHFVYAYHLKYLRFVYGYHFKYLRFHPLRMYPRFVYAYL
jgi:hypothetical protein